MIIVIDYGMGNLHSVRKALEVAGARVKVSSSPADIEKAEKIVFPGVGAFGEAMKELGRRKLAGPIKDSIFAGKPFLGLCLGLQLLFEKSEEAPGIKGLGVLRGNVKRFRLKGLKVPHMGWNNIKSTRHKTQDTRILKGIPDDSYMYFVHSYYADPKYASDVLTTSTYGRTFVSAVSRDNVYGTQFHPEKSHRFGMQILENFGRL